uniref:Uncharacterized protein n=1 Tax=Anthoceros angustus TaxID=48387 RepID=A0A2P1L4X9_ANTAG|nr:hypothetical protein AnanMp03 [Anthoceros angustus]AVP12852.1 hypothetical protein AnanMp03 [Anthoceros angustus]
MQTERSLLASLTNQPEAAAGGLCLRAMLISLESTDSIFNLLGLSSLNSYQIKLYLNSYMKSSLFSILFFCYIRRSQNGEHTGARLVLQTLDELKSGWVRPFTGRGEEPVVETNPAIY